jgi:RinA family phage transcriptional activator
MDKLRKSTFRHIESELYCYHETKKEIERIRNDIMFAGKVQQEGGRSGISNPTAAVATRLVTDKRLQKLEEVTDAIDVVVGMLDEHRLKLLRLRYWTRPQLLTWDGIAREVNVSRRQAIYWREEIILAIAERIGWR